MYRNRFVLVAMVGLLAVGLYSCSSNRELEKSSGNGSGQLDTLSLKSSIEMSRRAIVQQTMLNEIYRNGIDSILTDDDAVDRLMGLARGHYNDALRLQSLGQQDSSAIEFEKAIGVLNDLGYYPDIESDSDFVDLSRKIIGDYEKYISTIQNLGPGTSVFALQEKLSQIVDSINVAGTKFPAPPPLATSQVPLVLNRAVEQNVKFFTTRGRWHMQEWIYRSGRYIPMMKRIFAEDSLPPEIAYLSMPESGLNPHARSWARAVGLWQFIRSTGMLYGLQSNWWYDERRDPVKATEAAASHLKDLYDYYKNWYLAIAAYNCGSRSVNRAIWRSHGVRDFWKIRRFLPRETRNYVPQYIAVTMIAMNPKEYGFADSLAPPDPPCDTVRIPESVDLRVLAEATRMNYDSLLAMNPELVHGVTPPSYAGGGYPLLVPKGMSSVFAADYQKIPASQRLTWAFHTVRYGESLWSIARTYGVSITALRMANHLSWGRSRINPGMRLMIPVNSSYYVNRARAMLSDVSYDNDSYHGRRGRIHIVRRGETLSSIAQAFGTTVSRLKRLNNLSSSLIKPRMRLLVAASSPAPAKGLRQHASVVRSDPPARNSSAYHIIRSGETLSGIASEYGVTVADLKDWNNLAGSRITAGSRLRVTSPNTAAGSKGSNMIAETAGSRTVYRVRRGDSLWSIARKFGVSLDQLREWNDADHEIRPGQRLVIYN